MVYVGINPEPGGGMRVIGYVRVSTSEQAHSGASVKGQREAIRAEAARRGWKLVRFYTDTASGKSLAGREGLAQAVRVLERGQADALVVAKLDRLSRSLLDFAGLMDRSGRMGWSLVALDVGVDTTTPSGEAMVGVLAVFAQFERRLIAQRTKDALAVRRAEGVRLGRPTSVPVAVSKRLSLLRKSGMSYHAIADMVNSEGIPTAQGGARWYAATVRKVLVRSEAQAS
jgi:DNA invertase Pin-like site-specific DNA recombinase